MNGENLAFTSSSVAVCLLLDALAILCHSAAKYAEKSVTPAVKNRLENFVLCKENIRPLKALYMLLPIFNLFYFALLTLIYLHVMLKSVNYARRIFR